MPFDPKPFLADLTERPGVYRMIAADDQVLYVGKAKNLKRRVSSYFRKNLASPRIARMVAQIGRIETTVTRSEAEALLLENNLIKGLNPRYNILFRDDKSYPYIAIGKGKWPRLYFFRGAPDKRAHYFGPYPSSEKVRQSIRLLQKTFLLRTCEEAVFANRSRPCLLYQIRRCAGPCVEGLTNETDYARNAQYAEWFLQGKQTEVIDRLEARMNAAAEQLEFELAAHFRDQMQALRQIAEQQAIESRKAEDVDIVVAVADGGLLCVNLAMVRGGQHFGDAPRFPATAEGGCAETEAIEAFLEQHYARYPLPPRLLVFPPLPELADDDGEAWPVAAPHGAVQRAWVEMALSNARIAIAARRNANAREGAGQLALQQTLGLDTPPARIECFDISHTQGELPVASCVVWRAADDTLTLGGLGKGGGMRPGDYRRFNIRDVTPGDDYAAIHQAVLRRYAKVVEGEGVLPDVVLIDGGKGQVEKAGEALAELGLSPMLIGISKGEGRKEGLESIVFADGRPTRTPGLDDPALRLLIEIRDEAHRFAITGHRARRAKARTTSRLDEIPGVGPARRKALIARFGGLPGVREATPEQLAQTPGISAELAKSIFENLH
ncbi:MAG: excinuclease ABC subunit UvrC [Zoogloeaceae bacterium]|jgi:excinuclease ABC subunit C|nr:excinuclease ABC subunit UvrC [Zoogloeaceae bacterium]